MLYGPSGLFRYNGAGDWQSVELPQGTALVKDTAVDADNVIWAVLEDELFVCAAGETPCSPIALPQSDPLPGPVDARFVRVDLDNHYVYAFHATMGRRFYRGQGESWVDVTPDLPALPEGASEGDWSFDVRDGILLAATNYVSGSGPMPSSIIARISFDHGASWIDCSAGLSEYFAEDVTFDRDGGVHVVGRNGEVLVWTSGTPLR